MSADYRKTESSSASRASLHERVSDRARSEDRVRSEDHTRSSSRSHSHTEDYSRSSATDGAIRLSDIEPLCVLRALLRDAWMILAAAIVFAVAAGAYLDYIRTPVYSATMTYAVTSRLSSSYSSRNTAAANEVASVLTELLDASVIKDELRASYPELADFSGSIVASLVSESNFIVVTSTASTPKEAFLALRALIGAFPMISDYISSGTIVQVIKNPSVSSYPSNALNRTHVLRLATLAGAGLMALVLIWLNVERGAIQTRDGARHALDAQVICSITHEIKNRTVKTKLKKSNSALLISSPTVSFAFTEQIYALRSRIEHEKRHKRRRVFLITSVSANEGKSTVAANLAVALAQNGKRVALIDADLRNPSQNSIFRGRYSSELPLNKMLAEPFSAANLAECAKLSADTGVVMLFSVEGDRRATELLSSPAFASTLEYMRSLEYVIIDSPPTGLCPDAEVLAGMADASLMVVRQDVMSADDINDAVDALRRCRANFLGCVLNDMRSLTEGSGSYGYGKYGYGKYGYGYGYGRSGRGYGYGYGYGYTEDNLGAQRADDEGEE